MSDKNLDFYHDEVRLHPAASPQSRSARVYRVDASDMPMGNHNVNKMLSAAKRRHKKLTDLDMDDLTARKINEQPTDDGGYIEVVVVEP